MENVSTILENSALNHANSAIDKSKDVLFIDKNTQIADLQKFSKTKRRMSGNFKTSSISALAEFAESTIKESPEIDTPSCFVGEDGKASLFFNFGSIENPLHQDLTGSVSLKKTAVFKAIEELKDRQLTQRELAEFIEDFNTCAVALDKNGDVILQSSAIASIRDMSIESQRNVGQTSEDYRDTASAFASVEAKFKGATPAYLKFTIQPFSEMSEYEFIFRISVLTTNDRIALTLRCAKWDEILEEVNAEFQEKLTEKLAPLNVKTFIGNWN